MEQVEYVGTPRHIYIISPFSLLPSSFFFLLLSSFLYPFKMGDSGEGLVDAEARIQERMEEREAERRRSGGAAPAADPDKVRERESLKLAKAELTRQASATTHPVRKKQIDAALAEIEKRLRA
jgi:hypothetical protein